MLSAALVLFLLSFLVLWAVIYRVLPPAWRAVVSLWASLARAILRRERFGAWYERGVTNLRPLHPYRTLFLILAAGFLLAAATSAGFLHLAELMQDNNPYLERVDQAVWRSARGLRGPGVTYFFLGFTYLGTGVGLGLLVLIVAAVLQRRGHRRWAAFLVVTAAGNLLLNHGLKLVFARARPDMTDALWHSTSYAFPSGHAMGSLVVFGSLAYLVMPASTTGRGRSGAVALALTLVGAISLSRIYLGVHWFSDIVAGVSAGVVWLATPTAAYEVHRRMRLLRTTRAEGGTTSRAATAGDAPARYAGR
jgi:undecaprenyl-diphosphatase